MSSNYKPVGGVESVALYPADAVESAIFSSEGCAVQLRGDALEVELLDGASRYDEELKCEEGIGRVHHTLQLLSDRKAAEAWLDADFLERCAIEGVVAVVCLEDGRRLLVGYSSSLGDEQPLRLQTLLSSSGGNLHDSPTVKLQLHSYDKEFACEMIQQ